MVIRRRDFLIQSVGGIMSAGIAGLAVEGCQTTPNVPASCPPTRPNCRIIGIRLKTPAGGAQNLWETMRETQLDQGNWSQMAVVSNNLLPAGFWDVTDIVEVTVPQGSISGCDESHVLMTINSGPVGSFVTGEMLHKRQRADGTWTLFTTLSGGLGTTFVPARPWRFGRVAAARVNAELHVCGVTIQPSSASFAMNAGMLAHAVRRFNAAADANGAELRQWAGWDDVSMFTGSFGHAVDVGCAGVQNPSAGSEELHVCVVTHDGKLLHSVRKGPTTWDPFGDVASQAGARGPFTRVDCAARGNLLHVVAVGQSDRAWYTIRNATGSWRPFEDVQNAAGAPFSIIAPIYNVAIGLYNQGLSSNDWSLIIVGFGRIAHYTVLSSQPIWPTAVLGPRLWKPWTDLEGETAYTDGGSFPGGAVSWRPLLP